MTKDGDGKIVPNVDDVTLQVNKESKKIEIKANKSHSHSANDITIEDVGGHTAATEVESVLQEIYGKIGNVKWNGVAVRRGVTEGDSLTEAINALAAEIDAVDSSIEAVTGGTKTVIVDTEYAVKSVTTEAGKTSVMVTCADFTGYKTLNYKFVGKAYPAGLMALYIDDVQKASCSIQETDYTDFTGSYNISSLTGSHKIELKLEDVVLEPEPEIYSKLHSIEMEV